MADPITISRPSPNHGGPRRLTRGVIIHSTRGMGATVEAEFQGTLNWFANPASQVSAHDVIAQDGTLCFVVDDELEAWHAGIHNALYLGIELVQRNIPRDPFTQAQFRTLGWRLRYLSAKFGFPLTADRLPFHSQTLQGTASGKSDAVPRDDVAGIAAFRNALAPYLLDDPFPDPDPCAVKVARVQAIIDAKPYRPPSRKMLRDALR